VNVFHKKICESLKILHLELLRVIESLRFTDLCQNSVFILYKIYSTVLAQKEIIHVLFNLT